MNKIFSETVLFIRLGCDATEPVYWHLKVKDAEAQSGRLNNHTELKKISAFATGEVIILVSSRLIIYRSIKAKGNKIKNNSKFLRFSFEKSILGNIDDFHIVILKYDVDTCYVAAVEHQLMEIWIGWLTDFDISPTLMIPDVLTLPFYDGKGVSVKMGDECLIRNGEVSGFIVKDFILEKLSQAKRIDLSVRKFFCDVDQSEKQETKLFCEILRIMADNVKNSNVNFLCDRYYHNRKRAMNNASIFITISLCFLLSIVMLLNSLYYKYEIIRNIDMLNTASREFYAKYPSLKGYRLNDTQPNVDELSNNKGSYDFINLLHAASTVVRAKGLVINNINFNSHDREVILNINATEDNINDSKLRSDKLRLDKIRITKTPNDDETYNLAFKYPL
ncbi:type II secretion system protein GspL [Yersinia vastinensis]|uniref:type II secretion system protein GspL n=1 Tax=Yersinia vastinensis TaxID=2890318 RepID=UPI0005DBEB47|nr:type II secretion system protein GspL [Yersinia vastinensis]CNI57506.1 general secretion pathway protein L [Yersinia frederiksenii]CNK87090.1 general secretion pathway protein L [Yersinia frederiksenii]